MAMISNNWQSIDARKGQAYNANKKSGGRGLQKQQWLYIKDIVEDLSVHEETVRTWIKQKKLIAYRFGREYRIKPEDYQKFLENHRTDKDSKTTT